MKQIGIITGASSGLGYEFATQINKYFDLDELWLVARRKEKLQELADNLDVECKILPLDLTKDENYDEIVNLLSRENPVIKVLINNAGLGKTGLFKKLETAHLKNMIMVNSYHPVILTSICMPYFIRGASIINTSSAASFTPLPKFSVYAATKAFITSFSRAIAEELKRDKIKVLAVCPGPVATEFFDSLQNNKFNGLDLVRAEDVVAKAFYDLKKGRKMSIYGSQIKFAYLLSSILPNSILEKLVYFFKEV